MSSTEQKKGVEVYAIRGTKFLLTYDVGDYLDKDQLSNLIQLLSPVRELYINFHLGITRVAVWFKKQFSRKHSDIFRFEGNFPKIETIKGKDRGDWIKIISDFKASDKMTIRASHPRIEQRQLKNEQEEVQLKKKEQEEKKLEKEKQREANNERKKKLNRERTQKYREPKRMITQSNEEQHKEKQQFEEEKRQFEKEKQQFEKEKRQFEEEKRQKSNDEQEQINTVASLRSLQEQINKQNEIITKLQNHVNQVFGEEGSIEEEDEGDEEDVCNEEDEEIDEEDDTKHEENKDDDYDSMSQDSIEEHDFSDEETPEGDTDFTQCIGIEQNGEKCIRIRRNGDYCWFHDPENPQVCHKCGKRLLVKQGIVVNGRMKDPTGLFEDCDCLLATKPDSEPIVVDDAPAVLHIADAPTVLPVVPIAPVAPIVLPVDDAHRPTSSAVFYSS